MRLATLRDPSPLQTRSLGIVHHAIVRWLAREFPDEMGETGWPLPVVGEAYDGWLNDIAGFHITEEHVFAALESATTGPIAEGNVGGGLSFT